MDYYAAAAYSESIFPNFKCLWRPPRLVRSSSPSGYILPRSPPVASSYSYVDMIIIRDKMVEDRRDKQDRQDRQNSHYWHLNLTFQATCDWQLSQFFRRFSSYSRYSWILAMFFLIYSSLLLSFPKCIYCTHRETLMTFMKETWPTESDTWRGTFPAIPIDVRTTQCQIWFTIEVQRDPISKVLLEW